MEAVRECSDKDDSGCVSFFLVLLSYIDDFHVRETDVTLLRFVGEPSIFILLELRELQELDLVCFDSYRIRVSISFSVCSWACCNSLFSVMSALNSFTPNVRVHIIRT